MRGKWVFGVAVLAAAFLVFFLYRMYRVPPEIDFSSISLTNMEGNRQSLGDYTGRPLVISFAASWCGPCMKELKELQTVADKVLPVARVVVVSDETGSKIRMMHDRFGGAFEFLKLEGRFADIGIHSIPTTYLLNKNGESVKQEVGYISWSEPSQLNHLLRLMSN